jgi:hypothetical protein
MWKQDKKGDETEVVQIDGSTSPNAWTVTERDSDRQLDNLYWTVSNRKELKIGE